jgi:hypothetical protein
MAETCVRRPRGGRYGGWLGPINGRRSLRRADSLIRRVTGAAATEGALPCAMRIRRVRDVSAEAERTGMRVWRLVLRSQVFLGSTAALA